MKINLNITSFLIILAFSSCQKEVQRLKQSDVSSVNYATQSNLRTTSLPVVSLSVVIKNNYTDASANVIPYKIRNENGQQYVDGVDFVKAVIDQNGNFNFNTNISKNSLAKRFVMYDLSNPVDPSNTSTPGFARGYYYHYNYIFRTGSTVYGTSPFIPLQNLSIGHSECIYMNNNINGDGLNSIFKYTMKFHSGTEDNSISPSAFVIVKRVSDTQWTIEPGLCSTTTSNNVAAFWTGDTRNEIFKGYYHLPFFFTLTKKI